MISITSMKSSFPTSNLALDNKVTLLAVRAMLRHQNKKVLTSTHSERIIIMGRNRTVEKAWSSMGRTCMYASVLLSTKHCMALTRKLHTLRKWSARLVMGPRSRWVQRAVHAIRVREKVWKKTHFFNENPSVIHVAVMELWLSIPASKFVMSLILLYFRPCKGTGLSEETVFKTVTVPKYTEHDSVIQFEHEGN